MFIYSVRASTIKFFGVVLLSVAALVALILFIPGYTAPEDKSTFMTGTGITFDNIKNDEDRRSFLAQFGWETKKDTVDEETVTVPDKFSKIYKGYNEIQKTQGLDLEKYKRKEIKRYTYIVTNYPDYDGTVYANLLVYRNKVIGGDISSADIEGFVHGFQNPKPTNK
ncbi:MAG: DUF4830 domain-containing protein [Ruminococcaceae bacterium]|nr:DUF4830 domain-containing protein [Oscillospiraceae bacterium]